MANQTAVSPVPPDSAVTGWPNGREIAVRYLQTAPVRVQGLVSGKSYEFSGAHAVQGVDPRDVPGLVNTRIFRQVR